VLLLRHLGIARAHVAGRLSADWSGLATTHAEVIASLSLLCPTDLEPGPLGALASPLLMVRGDQGQPAAVVQRAVAAVPHVTLLTLRDYFGHPRADILADRTEEIGAAMLTFLAPSDQKQALHAVSLPEGEGEVAGISYRVQGTGPPLVLLPLGLAASQWEPLLPRLTARYCTIRLGGPWLGSVASLEARGHSPGYLGIVGRLIEVVQLQPGETILDVGCGSGVLDRWLAHRTKGENRIVAVDIHRELLREAIALAQQEGLARLIEFQAGNAEALPFANDTFDVTISATVMELLDADRMLHELIRVTRPGGRVAVIIRAVDMSSFVNLPLRPALKAKVEALPNGVAGEHGCADASLYRRFRVAGLAAVHMLPQLAAEAEAIRLHAVQQRILSSLSATEAEEWRVAVNQAEAAGTFCIALPYHCAVGTKPS
jgi:ubiquinone/menaquinone biosynthesis C-methylase UbiE